jgi:nitrogen PTS system EIIA component
MRSSISRIFLPTISHYPVNIESILAPDRTRCNIVASSRKKALEEIATHLAATLEGIDAEEIFTRLVNREKIGTTAIGEGIAIPHCRLDGCNSITGGLFTVQEPIDFHALDKTPVKVLFVLLVPVDEVKEHLEVLAMLAQRFESQDYRNSLITARQNDDLYRMATIEPTTDIRQQQG